MKNGLVIADSGPIFSLAVINQLELLFLMDPGESEAVILYKELNADYLLIDYKKARKLRKRLISGASELWACSSLLKIKTLLNI